MASEKKVFPHFKVYSPSDLSMQWFVYWRSDGKRHKRMTGINDHDTYDKRMAAAKKLIEELKKSYQPPPGKAMQRIWAAFQEDAISLRRKSWQSYQSVLRKLDKYLAGREPDADILQEWFKGLRIDLAPRTYNKHYETVARYLTKIGMVSLLDDVKKLRARSTPARYFQPHQVKRLKKHISDADPELWLFCSFIYYCAIRPNELRQLRVEHIEFYENKILVPGQVSKNHHTQYVAIPPAFKNDVMALMDRKPSAWLFPSKQKDGYPVSYNNMGTRHRKFLRKLGFGSAYKLYSWKHTGAVMAARAGVSLKELQLQFRHHSLDETDRYLRQMGVDTMLTIDKYPAL